MARYIKANPKVAQYLRLENDRNRVADGNYLLWQADMLAFGKLTDLPLILGQIGAIALAAHEAREEQDGTVIRELPVAEDPRFVVEPAEGDEPSAEDPEAGQDPQPETEAPAEDPEAGGEEPVEDPAGEAEPTDQEPEAEPEQPAEIEVPAEEPETETTNDETEI